MQDFRPDWKSGPDTCYLLGNNSGWEIYLE